MKVAIVRPYAYLDIEIDNRPVGRIVVELYDDLAPKSVENFLNLCNETHRLGSETLTYKNNVFHRVLKNFVIQCGDLKYGKVDGENVKYPDPHLGEGSISTLDSNTPFEDENLGESLDEPFKLCMANNGEKDSNGSQFFITVYPQPHLNGKHTVFGKVVHGKSVVREIERVDTDKNNVPLAKNIVKIVDCGEWVESMPVPIYNASYSQVGGDIYEEYPDDDTHIVKDSSESVYEASMKMKEGARILFAEKDYQNSYFKYRKCLRYVMEYFPDQDQEPEWYEKYYDLKKKLYLNLSLVFFKLENYQKSVDYGNYLLELEGLNDTERAKAHFRKGTSLLALKKYELALKDLKIANELIPTDKNIEASYKKCQELAEAKKRSDKAKYAKFFG